MLSKKVVAFTHQIASATPAPTNLAIVQVSRDQELSRLRASLLTSAGHSVLSISPEELTTECRVPSGTRVWVFCHTVEFHEFALMAVTLRRLKPADKLLRMVGLEDVHHAPGLSDGILDPIDGVDELIRSVSRLSTP